MRHVPETELLDAMKERLRDLEKIRLLSPTDLEILSLRRNLQRRIALLESQLLQNGKPAIRQQNNCADKYEKVAVRTGGGEREVHCH